MLGPRRPSDSPVLANDALADVTIGGGYTFARGNESVAIATQGAGLEPWQWYANGASRETPFGAETVILMPNATEQFLTVTRPQGPKTWRWTLRAPGLTPRLAVDGTVEFWRGNGPTSLVLLPVSVFDASGRAIGQADLRWSLGRNGSVSWLELSLDDSHLPLPYVIDPAATFKAASSAGNSGATTLVINKPAGVVADDFLIAGVTVRDNPTITAPTGWTLVRKDPLIPNPLDPPEITQAIYYKVAGGSEPASYTWTFSTSQKASGGILAYSGVDNLNPINAHSGATGSGMAMTAPGVITTVNDATIVGFFGIARSTGITPPTGMIERYEMPGSGGAAETRTTSEAADVVQATAGLTGNKTATAAQGADWIAQLVALRPRLVASRSTSTTVDCPASTPANSPASCTVTVRDTASGTKSPPLGTVDFSVSGPSGSTPIIAADPCLLITADTSSSSCLVEFTATTAGSYTIQGTYEPISVHATSTGTDTITVTAGPPALVTVDPFTSTNPVNSQHCVTATVTDAFGNPNSGVRVFFTVTGVNTASGVRTTGTDGTTGQFCYTGRLFGMDTIKAVADANGNNNPELTEPSGEGTKVWMLPPSTAFCVVDFVTYGVRITAMNGDLANAGGNARVDEAGEPSGQHQYRDHGPAQPMNVHSINVLAVTCSDIDGVPGGKQAQIFGEATIDGAGRYAYRIDVEDRGEPGTNDKYWISLSNGYDSGNQTLDGGNVKIH